MLLLLHATASRNLGGLPIIETLVVVVFSKTIKSG